MESLIRLENVSFAFERQHPVLNSLNMEIQEGQICGLLGPNGSGKSTLFNILTGLMTPGEGKLFFRDEQKKSFKHIRYHLGGVFQNPALDKKLTVYENLECQSWLYGITGKDCKQRISKYLELFGLEEKRNQLIEKLSGGEKRKTDVIRGILHEPDVLLMDEPSSGLDPGAREDFWRILKRLKIQKPLTIILTSHIMVEMENCNSLFLLNKGKVVGRGSPHELKKNIKGEFLILEPRRLGDLPILKESLLKKLGIEAHDTGSHLKIRTDSSLDLIKHLKEHFPDSFSSIQLSQPNLDDVFFEKTGYNIK